MSEVEFMGLAGGIAASTLMVVALFALPGMVASLRVMRATARVRGMAGARLMTVPEALAVGRIVWAAQGEGVARRLALRLSGTVTAYVSTWEGAPQWAVAVDDDEVAWSHDPVATEADACEAVERWLMAAGMGVPS